LSSIHAGQIGILHVVLDLLSREEFCSCHLCLFFCLCEKMRLTHVERRLHVFSLELLLETGGL